MEISVADRPEIRYLPLHFVSSLQDSDAAISKVQSVVKGQGPMASVMKTGALKNMATHDAERPSKKPKQEVHEKPRPESSGDLDDFFLDEDQSLGTPPPLYQVFLTMELEYVLLTPYSEKSRGQDPA